MSKNLPPTIEAYFHAMNAHDTAAMAVRFAENAIVQDEGQEYQGIAAVTQWIEATTEKYGVTVEITEIEERAGETIVTCQVSGNFPGSPAPLHFHFTLDGEKIAALTIQ